MTCQTCPPQPTRPTCAPPAPPVPPRLPRTRHLHLHRLQTHRKDHTMITHPSSPQQLSCIAAEVVSVQALNQLAAESPAVAYEVSGDHLAHGMSRHSIGVLTPDEARAAVALSNDLDGQIGFGGGR